MPTAPTVGRGPLGKPRSWLGVIGLTIITLGIYGLVWQYKTFKEMKDHTGNGIGGGIGLLLAIVFGIVNVFLMPAEVKNMYESEGKPSPVKGTTGLWILLPLVGGFIWLYKTQTALTDYWVSHGATKG